MPQQDKAHGAEKHVLEGRVFNPQSENELAEAIDKAFDYRGDVTLNLKDGSTVEGYLFNRDAETQKLNLFPKGKSGSLTLSYVQIETIAFTGEDTASGKSWEVWATKKESERKTEAEKLRQAALDRGDL